MSGDIVSALCLFGYLGLIALAIHYDAEIAEVIWKPKICVPSNEWRDLVGPIVSRCHLAKTLEVNTTFNPDGSNALATLLERMAGELDRRS